jgi:hypothetical protein
MIEAKCFLLEFYNIDSIRVEQFPELMLDEAALEKMLLKNEIRYYLNSYDYFNKKDILSLIYRENFSHIIFLKFNNKLIINGENIFLVGDCLYLDVSFSSLLKFIKQVNDLAQLKAFW